MARARQYRGLAADDRVAERRAQLIAAATRVYARVGYARATVRAICAEARLTARYFYESFPNQETLLRAAFRDATEGLAGIMREALADAPRFPGDRLAQVLIAYFTRLKEDGDGARVFLSEIRGISLDVDEDFRRAVRDLGEGFSEILGDLAAEPPLTRMGLAGAVVQIAVEWISTGHDASVGEVVGATLPLFARWIPKTTPA